MAINFFNSLAVGTNVLYVDALNDRVGIGTTSPLNDLHVDGNALVTSNATVRGDLRIDKNPSSFPTAKLQFLRNGSTSPAMGELVMSDNPGHAGMYMYARRTISPYTTSYIELPTSVNYDFEINLLGTNALTIDTSTRDVGIGTTSPRTKLDINGPLAVIGGTFTSGTSGADSSSDAGIVLRRGKKIFSGIPSSGNEDFYLRNLIEQDTSNTINIGQTGTGLIGNITLNTGASGTVVFRTTGTESMRLDSSGRLGVGTTSPDSKLQVDGAVQVADDTDTASANKVGAIRYRTSGNNSYVDMCMQTGASTYAWVNIVQNTW